MSERLQGHRIADVHVLMDGLRYLRLRIAIGAMFVREKN